jgi:hypothetical protein
MNIEKLLSVDLILLLTAISFCLSGWIILCLSFIVKASNYTGEKYSITPPNTFLLLFLGSLMFSLSDVYDYKWFPFITQSLVSCLNLSIYIIHKKTHRQRMLNENR